MRLALFSGALVLAVSCASPPSNESTAESHGDARGEAAAIPFEAFASFQRIEDGNPIIALEPPLWAAATHALVADDVVHYYWCERTQDRRWLTATASSPARSWRSGIPGTCSTRARGARSGRPAWPGPRSLGPGEVRGTL